MTHADLTRALAVERRQPVPTITREDQQLTDLRAVIHLLATAMNCRSDAS